MKKGIRLVSGFILVQIQSSALTSRWCSGHAVDHDRVEQCVRFILGDEDGLTLRRLAAYRDAKYDLAAGRAGAIRLGAFSVVRRRPFRFRGGFTFSRRCVTMLLYGPTFSRSDWSGVGRADRWATYNSHS